MKFRKRNAAPASETSIEPQSDSQAPARGRWSTTFLVVGSALLGATAIAFWNRSTIASMRARIQSEVSATPIRPSDEEIL